MRLSNFRAVRKALYASAVLTLFAAPSGAQIVEKERTFADLTASHPCSSGYTGRNAIVTDCDAADDIGDGGGAFRCFAHCDGTAPWEAVAIGGGAGGGVSGLDTADGGTALADNSIVRGDGTTGIQGSAVTIADTTGDLQWEGTTADAFEGNFTFADPTADWTWNWLAAGAMRGPDGTSALPAYGFASDPNTGLYLAAPDALSLTAGGVDSAYVLNNLFSLNVDFNSWEAIRLGATKKLSWSDGANPNNNWDTGLIRSAAGIVGVTDALHLTPIASPPRTCDATAEGDLYSDSSHALCYCQGSAWTVVIGAGSCS